MFGWLDKSWQFIAGLPRNSSKLLHRMLHAIVGWATNIFHIVGHAWDDLATAFQHWSTTVRHFMDAVFSVIAKIVTHTIPELARNLAHDIAKVASDIADLARTAARWVDNAIRRAESLVSDALVWVRHNVLDPLSRDINSALSWIANIGKEAWRLVHDGEYIAALVLRWIWSQLLSLIRTYITTVMRWIIGSGLSFSLSVAHLVEDALTAVL